MVYLASKHAEPYIWIVLMPGSNPKPIRCGTTHKAKTLKSSPLCVHRCFNLLLVHISLILSSASHFFHLNVSCLCMSLSHSVFSYFPVRLNFRLCFFLGHLHPRPPKKKKKKSGLHKTFFFSSPTLISRCVCLKKIQLDVKAQGDFKLFPRTRHYSVDKTKNTEIIQNQTKHYDAITNPNKNI